MQFDPATVSPDSGVDILDEETLTRVLEVSGVDPKWNEHFFSAAKSARGKSADWNAWTIWQAGGGKPESCPIGVSFVPPGWSLLHAARQILEMLRMHRSRGIPDRISSDTARDLALWVEESNRLPDSKIKFPVRWFNHHASGRLLRIGRLQFEAEPWALPFDVYVDRESGANSIAVAHAGIRCDSAGWPTEKNPAFVTARLEAPDNQSGHLASPINGAIDSGQATIRLKDWHPVLFSGQIVLQIHIPHGERLDIEDCRGSIEQARRIYPRYWPEVSWCAFCCSSWLLDRELWSVLPRGSNIRSFGELFTPLTTERPDDRQMIERVFDNVADLGQFQPRTFLQREILKQHRAGRVFREITGYIL